MANDSPAKPCQGILNNIRNEVDELTTRMLLGSGADTAQTLRSLSESLQ